MRIQFLSDGGFAFFPGLNKVREIDTSELQPELAAEVESAVREADFFNQPAQAGAPAQGAADFRTYTISVQEGNRSHTVRLSDPVQDPKLQSLISCLRGVVRSRG